MLQENNLSSRGFSMQFNTVKETDESIKQIILPETTLLPVTRKRSLICQKCLFFCYLCGKNWLFDSPKNSDSYLWCNSDICGTVCAVFTWLLILHPSFVLMFVVFVPVDSNWFRFVNGSIFYFLAAMATLSHIKSVFTDPGTVAIGNATEENIKRLDLTDKPAIKCIKCDSIKPSRAHHCSVCRRCIRKMDHHCPWINNCVGEDNQKYFILFTFYIFLMSAFALYICIHFFIICVKGEWKDFLQQKDVLQKNWFEFSPLTKSLLLLSVTFESIVFGLFTLIMCITQLCSVANDKTGIESLVKESPKWEHKSCWVNISTTFNQPFSWKWFCPLLLKPYKRQTYDNELHVV